VGLPVARGLRPGARGPRVDAGRPYLTERLGPRFRFDAHVREFVAAGAGRTLDELVAHWEATRTAPPRPIASQFELNRFLRRWHLDHPGRSHAAALAAWRAYRARPLPPAEAPTAPRAG